MVPIVLAYFLVPSWNLGLWLVIGASSTVGAVAGIHRAACRGT